MARFVRYLTIAGHEIEVIVSQIDDRYLATVRLLSDIRDQPRLETFQIEADTVDEAERLAQNRASDLLASSLLETADDGEPEPGD